MYLIGKTNITKQDIEVAGKSYETVIQFINLGLKINSKNSIQTKIRLIIQAGNRSLFANKKLLKTRNSTPPINYRYIKLPYYPL
jgi:hypothetical protein